jgi:hypothetical protein
LTARNTWSIASSVQMQRLAAASVAEGTAGNASHLAYLSRKRRPRAADKI